MVKFIATPKQRRDPYPWRPMDNRERRAAWALLYYQQWRPKEIRERR